MVFVDPYFLVAALVLIILSDNIVGERIFLALLLLFSNLFLFICIPPESIILIYCFVLTGFWVTTLTLKYGRKILWPSLTILLAEYLVFHSNITAGLLSGFNEVVGILGFSYILCRMIHLLVDSAGEPNSTVSIGFWDYLTFNLSFLTFLSGPLQRYNDYQQALQERVAPVGIVRQKALGRMLVGYLKLLLAVPLAHGLYVWFAEYSQISAASSNPLFIGYGAALFLFGASMMLPLYVYLNFSAYMDLVIGLARLIGFRIPENFNRPLLAESLLEWWTRWHITMSEWYRDYIYNPTLMLLCRWSMPRSHGRMTLYAILGLMVTFIVVGLWHAVTLDWLVMGLILGSGISINRLWSGYLHTYFGGKRYGQLRQVRWYRAVSTALTHLFIAILGLGFLVITGKIPTGWSPTWHEILVAVIVGFVGLLILGEMYRFSLTILDAFNDSEKWGQRFIHSPLATTMWSAFAICIVVLIYLRGMIEIPEFVYAQF